MNAINISFGLLITLFAILLLYKMRKLKPQAVRITKDVPVLRIGGFLIVRNQKHEDEGDGRC